jgi:hypothetical protein
VLADYVLALLSHDGDADTIRQMCEAEIPDFLKEGVYIDLAVQGTLVLVRGWRFPVLGCSMKCLCAFLLSFLVFSNVPSIQIL